MSTLLLPADPTSQRSRRRSEGQGGKVVAAARASEATNPPMRVSQEFPGDNSDIPVTRREKLFFYKIKLVKQKQINALLIDQQLSRHKHVGHEVSFLEHTKSILHSQL